MRNLRCNGGSPYYYGYNVDFIAQYLYENPGTSSKAVKDALARTRGRSRVEHGWMSDYFYYHRPGTQYAGRLWEHVDYSNPRRGWVLTLEGYGRVKNP